MTRLVDSTLALSVVTPDGSESVRVVKDGVSKRVLLSSIADSDVAAHVAESDPHTQYLTEAAAAAAYQPIDADLTTWSGITPGEGVATALAVNVGSAGSPVVNGGALGTPSSGAVSATTAIATGGSTARTLAAHFGDIVNVKNYGVTGDGSTDDTAAIEACISATVAGSTILFPSGMNCLVSSEVDLTVAGHRFIGYGAKITKHASFTGSGIIRASANNITIEGFEIDGTDQADDGIITDADADGLSVLWCTIYDCAYGISANNVPDILLQNNNIYSVADYCIRAHNIADTRALNNIRILDNRLDQSTQDPLTSSELNILVRGTASFPTTGVNISGNEMIHCEDPTNSGALGCEMRYVNGGSFSSNYSKDGGMLVSVALSSNVTVDGNVCDGATFYGIEVAGISPTGCENVVVSNNTIHGRDRLNYAIGIQGTSTSKGVSITGNTSDGTTLYGVFVNDKWTDVDVSGNRINITATASNQFGIYLLGSATPIDRVTISGNILNGNGVGEKAIYLRDVRYATVTGNTMPGWTENGVLVHSSSATCDEISITGNSINGLSSTAIGKSGTLGSRVSTSSNPPYRRSNTTAVNDINLESAVFEAWGTVDPESNVTAGIGSIYHRTSGGAGGTTTFEKASGTGNTGWASLGLQSGATTDILVGGGASTPPVWTTATGTGSPVRATSPTLVTPVLGTVAAGSVLTNATGLPVSTGISGLGTGIATFLGTPSSANLAAAMTDETGSGAAVFATSPTFGTSITVASTGNTSFTVSSSFSGSTTTGCFFDTVGDTSAVRINFSKSASTKGYINYRHNASGTSEALGFVVSGGSDKLTILGSGHVGIATTSPSGSLLDVNDDSIRIRTANTPASASATGVQGEISWDASYIYVCTATNTWRRVAHATW